MNDSPGGPAAAGYHLRKRDTPVSSACRTAASVRASAPYGSHTWNWCVCGGSGCTRNHGVPAAEKPSASAPATTFACATYEASSGSS